jgi:undecaprenyl phosphate-alpha-L-ara4N flippase subunit ArnE
MNTLFQQQHRNAILLMILCTIFTSLGEILWKFGVNKIEMSAWITFFNLPFVMGFVSYGIGAILILLAFQRGELSILYPIIATSYVWVSLISPWLFPTDSMNIWKWAGVLIILASVSVLGWKGHIPGAVKNG